MGLILAALGLGLVLLTTTLYFLTINKEKVPSARAPTAAGLVLGMVVSGAGLALGPGWAAGTMFALAASVGGLLVYLLSIAKLPDGSLVATLGEPMPPLQAVDHDGNPFKLGDLRGRRIMVKFFRGSW